MAHDTVLITNSPERMLESRQFSNYTCRKSGAAPQRQFGWPNWPTTFWQGRDGRMLGKDSLIEERPENFSMTKPFQFHKVPAILLAV